MRLDDYDFVFTGWMSEKCRVGWSQAVHLGLPYVEFHVVSDTGFCSVRCDPCSLDQDQTAYAAMVRADLEGALAKVNRS